MMDHWAFSPNWEAIEMSEAQELANQGEMVVTD